MSSAATAGAPDLRGDDALPAWEDLWRDDDSSVGLPHAVRAAASLPVERDFLDPDVESDAPLPVEPPELSSKFVTLAWAEPLAGRNEKGLRMAVMRAVARLKLRGVPIGGILIEPKSILPRLWKSGSRLRGSRLLSPPLKNTQQTAVQKLLLGR